MKEFRIFYLATAVLFGTALLIAAFIILFSYAGQSSNELKEKAMDKTSVVSKPVLKK